MPYRKGGKYRRRRKPLYKQPATTKPPTTMDKVKKYAGYIPWVLSTVSKLRGLTNAEVKYSDTSMNTNPSNAGQVSYCSGVTQDVDNNQRIGRSIKLVNMSWTYMCELNAGVTLASQVRIIVFIDYECNGAAPAVLDLLSTADITSPYNMVFSLRRFRVLYDKLFALSKNGTACVTGHEGIPYKGHVYFEGISNGIASAGKGSIFCLHISNEATNTPNVNMRHRIRYVDD